MGIGAATKAAAAYPAVVQKRFIHRVLILGTRPDDLRKVSRIQTMTQEPVELVFREQGESMNLASSLAPLFERDLTRLAQEIAAFPDDATLWRTPAGITNPAGNLVLHLEGNLREYVGRILGGHAYVRERAQEFALRDVSREELLGRIDALKQLICSTIAGLTSEQLESEYPVVVFEKLMTVEQFVIHLYGHLSWHLGQIDTTRRVLTGDGAIQLAGL